MARPADQTIASLAELRFEPANSNDAARAVLAHHFVNVPRCSFARDDGIFQYLASEAGMDTFPALPAPHETLHRDIPAIRNESPDPPGGSERKLARSGFALSILLHAIAAIAMASFISVTLPEDDALMEGVTSISLVVEGSDADLRAAGDTEEVQANEERPEPVTEAEPEEKQPVEHKAEEFAKELPMPELGAGLPEILTAAQTTEAKVDVAVIPDKPIEKQEPKPVAKATQSLAHPISRPNEVKKPVAKKVEEEQEPVRKDPDAKQEPKEAPEREIDKKKDKPKEKRKNNRGNRGKDAQTAKRGEDTSKKGKQVSDNSRGASKNRELGNSARTNYKGLVQKKLQRAKGRMRSPGKGKVTVAFTISADGSIAGLSVARSSGKEALDAAALKIVRSASPFPAIPAETGRKTWKMSVPIDFK